LHNLAIDFAERFNREIHRTYSYSEMNGEAIRKRDFNELVERFAKWRASAPYPGLIKNVFLAVAEEDDSLTLMLLHEQTHRFNRAEWPARLASLRERFDPEPIRKRGDAGLFARVVEHGYIAGEAPAVLRFFPGIEGHGVSMRRPGGENPREEPRREEPRREGPRVNVERAMKEMRLSELGFAIIELDPDYIRQVFIPALAQLSVYRGIEYDLAVVNRSGASDVLIYGG